MAIFFLARWGVEIPEWWNEWRKGSESKILFYVMCPREATPLGRWRWVEPIPTEWCHKSLVLAYQKGLQQIFKEDKKERIQCVYFVSGADLPVKKASRVNQPPFISTFCSVGSLARDDYEIKKQNVPESLYKPLMWYAVHHVQWVILERKHALIIAYF